MFCFCFLSSLCKAKESIVIVKKSMFNYQGLTIRGFTGQRRACTQLLLSLKPLDLSFSKNNHKI